MLIGRLSRMIDAALTTLSCSAPEVGLTLEPDGHRARVSIGSLCLDFGSDPLDDMLAWELLADALPGAVERARLTAMHDAAGAAWAQPWSVNTTATALAWLTWASGGAGTPRWRHNVAAILAAAEYDGSVSISAVGAAIPMMSGVLRSRQLLGLIQTGPRSHYIVARGELLSNDTVPHTIAIAAVERDLATVVEAPWLAGWDVVVADTAVGEAGTLLILKEELVPLEPIPSAAAGAAPRGGPGHAPWIVTEAERAALDAIDRAAHRDA